MQPNFTQLPYACIIIIIIHLSIYLSIYLERRSCMATTSSMRPRPSAIASPAMPLR